MNSWFDDLLDSTRGIFHDWIDYESWRAELGFKQAQSDAIRQVALATAPRQSSGFLSGTAGKGISLTTLAIVAGVGFGAWFLVKKL